MQTRRTFVSHVGVLSALSSAAASISTDQARAAERGGSHDADHIKIPQTDLQVSRIAHGCADLVPWNSSENSKADIDNASRIINTAYDHGITFFDHADLYAYGRAESAFGEVLRRTAGLRHKITIQSKCGQLFRRSDSGMSMAVDLSGGHIIDSVEGSLRRLATDRLDILLLHAPDFLMQPEEVAKAFDHLHQSGKVRYFGVSNHAVAQIELLRRYVRQPIVANQIHISLLDPGALLDGFAFTVGLVGGTRVTDSRTTSPFAYPGILDYCRSNGIQIQAWSPLKGILHAANNAKPEVQKVAQPLRELAEQKGISPASLALAWLIRHPAKIVPVVGARKPEHVAENAQAADIEISRDDWYRLLTS